jgi:hypothetical protein
LDQLFLVVYLLYWNSASWPQFPDLFHYYVEEVSIAFPFHFIRVAPNQLDIFFRGHWIVVIRDIAVC